MARMMRAAVFEDFGGPEVIEIKQVPVPDPVHRGCNWVWRERAQELPPRLL